ncbi:DUF1573 domain-containing protein [Polaribacter sp. Hel_I_88]|uniref:DUF1573 domain-containing protein n=1 Tax=Polaribacter sp. Hel_I_88 TaxID=1250006 RepID=UPI00047C91F6|nr:DUF1573 domain-containing protein [Polaribacter sp. Hel_I_88]
MKTILALFFIGFFNFAINAQEFKFDKTTIDYGKIDKNANGVRTFTFTNIGDQPLIIKDIKSTCGCTIPEKPEKPILPNEKGTIKVSYNTKIIGGFSKSITILSNAKNERTVLKIKGFVYNGVSLEKEKSMLSNDH